MNETTKVFALLGDAALRRELQRLWRRGDTLLCGMHAEGGDSIVEEIARVRPRVVLVDAEVDGARPVIQAAALRHRLPAVALVRAQAQGFAALRPLEWGAVALAARAGSTEEELAEIAAIVAQVRRAQVVDVLESHFPLSGAFPDASVFDLRRSLQALDAADKLVLVAAGVGGPMALRRILTHVRDQVVSPIVVVQRMAASLLPSLAAWLEHHTGAQVQMAATGPLQVGGVYIVPAASEARVGVQEGEPYLQVHAAPTAAAPSIDGLLESAARTYGERSVAVLLTGHGTDGARGLGAVRQAGGFTMVQDRVSSLVYDTPGHARDGGGAIECLPINEIAERIQMLMRPEPAERS